MVRSGGGLRESTCNESSKISCVVRGFGMVGWSCDGGGEGAWAEGEDTRRMRRGGKGLGRRRRNEPSRW